MQQDSNIAQAFKPRTEKDLLQQPFKLKFAAPSPQMSEQRLNLLKRLPTYIGTVWTARHSHGTLCCYDLHAASHQATNATLCLCTPLLSSTASDMRTLQVNATVSQHSYCAIPCTCPMLPPHSSYLFRVQCATRGAVLGGVARPLPQLAAAYCHGAYPKQLQIAGK